jgi:hypothetical protein
MNEMMMCGGNNGQYGGHFDFQQLMDITGKTAMNANRMSEQLGIIATAVDSIRTDVDSLTGRIDLLEQKEEITTTQVEEIRKSACKRVYEILGDDKIMHAKYYRTFIGHLYRDMRRYAGLGSSISRTRKCEYQNCIDKIEAWNPSETCSGLKHEVDEKAKAIRVARQQGYEC